MTAALRTTATPIQAKASNANTSGALRSAASLFATQNAIDQDVRPPLRMERRDHLLHLKVLLDPLQERFPVLLGLVEIGLEEEVDHPRLALPHVQVLERQLLHRLRDRLAQGEMRVEHRHCARAIRTGFAMHERWIFDRLEQMFR